MIRAYFEEEEYKNLDLSEKGLQQGEYDNCVFSGCQLSGMDLSAFTFVDCLFIACDLSTCKLSQTAFTNTRFDGCKLIGLQFDQCHEYMFSVQFENCQLQLSSFFRRQLRKAWFKNCRLCEVDFAECNLSEARLINCDLQGAVFDHTNLEKADLSTAFAYSINPNTNKINKARFAVNGLPGLLDNYGIIVE